jgi:hypothetical protein
MGNKIYADRWQVIINAIYEDRIKNGTFHKLPFKNKKHGMMKINILGESILVGTSLYFNRINLN